MSSSSTSSSLLPLQVSFYTGINLQDILYGIELCLYFKTMQTFLSRKRARHKSDAFYAVFSSVVFVLATLWVVIMGIFGQEQWLPKRNYPGGPIAYVQRRTAYALIDVTAMVAITLQQMTDGLMMYRCRIVWGSLRVIVIPFILWLAALALGILAVWASSTSATNFFSGSAAKFGLMYYSISVFLDTTLTGMICYQLVHHANTMKKYFGEDHAAPYLSIMRLLVESVLPLTLSGIAFLVSYGIGSPVETAVSLVYVLMMCISSQMLILRVAQGNAWKKESMKPPLSVMMFPSGGGDTSASGDTDGGVAVGSLPGISPPKSGKGNEVQAQV